MEDIASLAEESRESTVPIEPPKVLAQPAIKSDSSDDEIMPEVDDAQLR